MINKNNKKTFFESKLTTFCCQLTNDINKSVIIITVNNYLKRFKALFSFIQKTV